jgi:MFS family permease
MLIVQMLPMGLVGPLAGVVVDRMNRRRIMMAADVIRGCLVLGLLLVRRADQIWIAYLVTALTVAAQAHRLAPSRSRSDRCSSSQGILWLVILSRWRESGGLTRGAEAPPSHSGPIA